MGDDRRRELASFLRSRREQITPAQAGLPTSARRRTRGLRREEVAVLAGVSPTWYTYLEQGRDIHPSSEVLDSLSRVLGLDEDERRYVHRLATGRLPEVVAQAPDEQYEGLVADVVAAWGDDGLPIYAANQVGEMVAWNPATAHWYTDFDSVPADRRNMIRWMFTTDEARSRFVDWDFEAANIVARLRAQYASRSWDTRFGTLVRSLSEESPDFRRMWHEQHVREQRARVRRMNVPRIGVRAVRLVVVRMADDPFNGIVIHLPVAAPVG